MIYIYLSHFVNCLELVIELGIVTWSSRRSAKQLRFFFINFYSDTFVAKSRRRSKRVERIFAI